MRSMNNGMGADGLNHFYQLIDELEAGVGEKRYFGRWGESWYWPRSGAYLLMERSEKRSDGSNKLRITRVGTHALSDTGRAPFTTGCTSTVGFPEKATTTEGPF